MKKIENICYELNKDFSEVKSLFIKEKLDKESLGEGLEPEIYELKIALTLHSIRRMNERNIKWSEVEEILLAAGSSLLKLKNGEKFSIFTEDRTFAIIGNVHYQQGNIILIVHTIVHVQRENGDYKKIIVNDTDETIIAMLP